VERGGPGWHWHSRAERCGGGKQDLPHFYGDTRSLSGGNGLMSSCFRGGGGILGEFSEYAHRVRRLLGDFFCGRDW
jgi:hypothetical protein